MWDPICMYAYVGRYAHFQVNKDRAWPPTTSVDGASLERRQHLLHILGRPLLRATLATEHP